jgi:hypothetical protein
MEMVVTYLKVLSLNLDIATEENHRNPQSGYPVNGQRFELGSTKTEIMEVLGFIKQTRSQDRQTYN